MLQALYSIDVDFLQASPRVPPIYYSGVVYIDDPDDSDADPIKDPWRDIPATLAHGGGDCEDLACWRAAELTVRFGIPARPVFRRKTSRNGGILYHIIVQYPNGMLEDPSAILGMYQLSRYAA